MMRAAIVVNGYYSSESYRYQTARLQEELEKAGVSCTLFYTDTPTDTDSAFDFDFAFFTDKDVTLAKLMEAKGVRLFNSADCIENTDSKGKTAAVLSGDASIRQQKTIFRPKRYKYERDELFLRQVGEKLGYPLIAKESRGSLGEQVYLIRKEEELFRIDEKMGLKEGVYQAYRAGSEGKSIRVIVVGGKAVGAMLLESEGDFRSNAHQGGKGTPVRGKEEWLTVAERVAKRLQADYVGVDLFYDEPVVIEANGNAFFEEFEQKTGINVAETYIKYSIRSMNNE